MQFADVASFNIMPPQASQALKTALFLAASLTGYESDREPLWREWKRLLYSEFNPPRNLDQLAANMKESWRMLGMAGTPTSSPVSVTRPRGRSGLSTMLREAPPSTEYFHQNNRSFLRPPNLSKRESFRFKELNFQKLKFAVLSNLSLLTFSFIT